MKRKVTLLIACLMSLLLFSTVADADATPAEWTGDWKLNHDGHLGTLNIRQGASGLVVRYQPKGKTSWYTAENSTLSDKGQHLSLTFNFDGSRQPFDLYIFSWDKHQLAGTTVWSNRTFGVSGTQEVPQSVDASDCCD